MAAAGKQGAMVAACWSLVCAALVGLSATVRCGGLAQWAVSLAVREPSMPPKTHNWLVFPPCLAGK